MSANCPKCKKDLSFELKLAVDEKLSALREENAKLRRVVEIAKNRLTGTYVLHRVTEGIHATSSPGLGGFEYDERCWKCRWDKALREIEGK